MLRAMVLMFGLMVASTQEAHACRCVVPDVISSYQTRDHAFVARAVSVQMGAQYHVWTFRLVKDLKGCERPGATIRVVTASDPSACGASFTPGVSYLVYATDVNIGGRRVWQTTTCDGNRELSQLTRDEIGYLMDRPITCNGVTTCANGSQPVSCLVDPCTTSPACRGATCEANYCGGCTAEWYDVNGAGQCMPW